MVEVPFFIFPVILILVGEDLFPSMGELSWIGLGVIGTFGTLAAALPSPYFGWLADRYRRGVMMAGSLLVVLIGSLMIGWWGNSFFVVFFGVILMGVGLALYHPPGLSWVSSAFEDPNTKSYSKNYVKILALHGIGGSLGASLGPLSVYFLINVLDSWQQVYLIWSIPLTVVMIGFWVLVGRKEPKNSFQPIIATDPSYNNTSLSNNNNYHSKLYFIFFFIIMMSLTRGMISFILSPFLSETKNVVIATAALLIGISTLIGSTGQVFGGIIGDKYGETAILSATALIQVFVLSVIFFSVSIPVLFLFYILLGLLNALFWPSTNSIVAKNSKRRGSAFGYVMLSANLIGALGPVMDGILLVIDPNQYSLIFIFAGSFSLLAFISLVFLEFKIRKGRL
jgi:MFS family permease